MNVVIIFDHPYGASASENIPHRRSYSAALLAAVMRGLAAKGHKIDLIDLATDGFNPVMSAGELASWRQKKTTDPLAADYQRRLIAADHIVFIFPVWWETMPALTKGFLDKVFVEGTIYKETKPGRPFHSLLPNVKGVSLLTVMSTPDFIYRWLFGNPVTKILFRGTFRKIGIRKLRWFNYTGMKNRSPETRRQYLIKTEQRFAQL
ncbi:NAD(P)H-dependent oxidoreductase [Paenibacillus sepulcri]|uniref:NAD(P)H-dependent oxidoreductase n=1 Tax=Paenibacillus sepulcri TaxID=359917 RepID=A0ABS7C274_9BACL|nr:NAD(P)H-dependent oxidoreductase [Paenibacillus sepulcri]